MNFALYCDAPETFEGTQEVRLLRFGTKIILYIAAHLGPITRSPLPKPTPLSHSGVWPGKPQDVVYGHPLSVISQTGGEENLRQLVALNVTCGNRQREEQSQRSNAAAR